MEKRVDKSIMKHQKKHHNIYLFDLENKSQFQNSLKEFIYYLRFTGIKGIIDFSYASSNESIHPHLSVKENFILESVPKSLIKNKEDNFQQRIEELENSYLVNLIHEIENIENPASELNRSEIKLCSIVKALLSSSEYIFLELPDKDLEYDTLKKIKKCLMYEVEHHDRIVFIRAHNSNSWLDITTEIISKDENRRYKKIQNPLNSVNEIKSVIKKTKTKEQENVYNFTLYRKAS